METKKINYDLVNRTRHEVKRRQQKTGKRLTRRQIKRIMILANVGLITFSGIIGGKTALALNEAKENARTEIEIDATGKNEINIENVNFKDGLKVKINGQKVDLNEITINEDIDKKIDNIIDGIGQPADVLTIVKEEYANKYNTAYGQNISSENIQIHPRNNVLY